MKGETIAPGMKVVNLEKGHTNVAAEYIRQAVGGDLFEIETVKTYIFPCDAFDEKKYSYGITVCDLPERWLGEEACISQYHMESWESFEQMTEHLAKALPNADRKDIEKLLK